ncbi:MAG TPA: peptidoglycan-binding domain-containing protein [Xanthobacteraceae bacterium]|nr:peptidoglycan-binding domain-containing protein [Xanthobacteraceae bacterium]
MAEAERERRYRSDAERAMEILNGGAGIAAGRMMRQVTGPGIGPFFWRNVAGPLMYGTGGTLVADGLLRDTASAAEAEDPKTTARRILAQQLLAATLEQEPALSTMAASADPLKDVGADKPAYAAPENAARDPWPYTLGPDPNEPEALDSLGELISLGGSTVGGPTGVGARAALAQLLARPAARAAIAGGVAAGVPLALSASADTTVSEQVKALQREMQAAGFYGGKIDGVMGPQTQEAKMRYDAHQARMRELAAQEAAAKAASDKTAAEAAQAEAAKAAAAVQAEKQRLDAERKAAADKRLKDMEANRSWVSALIQDYAPMAGYAAGIGVPLAVSKGLDLARRAAAARAAARGDRIMAAAAHDWPGRAGRVNEFWTTGGSPQAPFLVDPRAPAGFALNPSSQMVSPASELYRIGKGPAIATDLAFFGAGLVDWAYGEAQAAKAREELEAAQAAVAADASEANIQRLETAKNAVGLYDMITNAGRGATGAGGLHAFYRWRGPAPSGARPESMGLAEAERIRIGKLLARSKWPPWDLPPRGPDGRFVSRR